MNAALARKKDTLVHLEKTDSQKWRTNLVTVYRKVPQCGEKIDRLLRVYPSEGEKRQAQGRVTGAISALFECAAQVVEASIRAFWIDDLKGYVIAGFKLADYRIELIFGGGGLLVDANDHQSGHEARQV